jgi:hypothetical protein
MKLQLLDGVGAGEVAPAFAQQALRGGRGHRR